MADAENLKNEIAKLASQKNINFVGKIDNNKLPDYYNAADVLIVPSTHEEGFGRVILEALSCGLPVIASNRGGIIEALSKEVGIFIDVTAGNISKALRVYFNQPFKLKKLVSNTTTYARAHFSEKNVVNILKHYE